MGALQQPTFKPADHKKSWASVLGWIIYDWGNSAFSTIIVTFVFATYFTEKVAVNKIIGTEKWGHATAYAAICIALLSPVFGAIADNTGLRKPWLAVFSLISILGSASIWYIKPEQSYTTAAISIYAISLIAFEVAQVFYNTMLNDVAPTGYVGRISGWGWGVGYFGGLAALVIFLFLFIQNPPNWLNSGSEQHIRISGPFVALWFSVFSIPIFALTKDHKKTGKSVRTAVWDGLKQLRKTLISVGQYKDVVKFLLARLFYIDGLNTVFAFGGIYAAGVFGMNIAQIIQFAIAMNVVAGIGAFVFAWLDDIAGPKTAVSLSLVLLFMLVICVLLAKTELWFWIFALSASFFVGPIQAASRSMMTRLAPPEYMSEMFGLYSFSGKITAFTGPWLLGTVTYFTDSQRWGMSIVLIFLGIGLALLLLVKEK